MMQFSLISLIPGLIRGLEDCADPELANYEKRLVMPASLKTSERNSCGIPFSHVSNSLTRQLTIK